jgi:4-hydroxy-tetrahydrodipicolinate synthase
MQITPPFGRLITAMVTPFKKSGEIDWAGIESIANHLVSTGQPPLMMKKMKLLK